MLQVAFFYAPWVWEVYSADIIADEDWNEEMVSRPPSQHAEASPAFCCLSSSCIYQPQRYHFLATNGYSTLHVLASCT